MSKVTFGSKRKTTLAELSARKEAAKAVADKNQRVQTQAERDEIQRRVNAEAGLA